MKQRNYELYEGVKESNYITSITEEKIVMKMMEYYDDDDDDAKESNDQEKLSRKLRKYELINDVI